MYLKIISISYTTSTLIREKKQEKYNRPAQYNSDHCYDNMRYKTTFPEENTLFAQSLNDSKKTSTKISRKRFNIIFVIKLAYLIIKFNI